MIPIRAVEAAAKALAITEGWDGDDWSDIPEQHQKTFHEQARDALEAANPHAMAHVWDVAYQAALEDEAMNRPTTPNPYRPAP